MNRLTVIGRIVRDTELRDVGDGKLVMNNTIAIPRAFKTEQGQDTDFLNFVAWGKRAELIEEFCNKGDLIGLDGRIQSRTYQKDSNQKVYIVEMNVESVYFLQNRRKKVVAKTVNSNRQTQNETNRQATDNQRNSNQELSDDEIDINTIQTANS